MCIIVSFNILAAGASRGLLIAGSILAGLILVLGIFVYLIRRRAKKLISMYSAADPAFTIAELEKMRDSGAISREEFKKVRSHMMRISENSDENSENSHSSTPPTLDDSMLDSDN